jgi:hypothetical protein
LYDCFSNISFDRTILQLSFIDNKYLSNNLCKLPVNNNPLLTHGEVNLDSSKTEALWTWWCGGIAGSG